MAVERIAGAMAWAELRGRDRGLRGASGLWLGVWVVSVAYRHLRKMTGPDPVVIRETIRPGQQLVITHFPEDRPPAPLAPAGSRRARRKARKADRS